ncbi:Amine oxidase [flavin-containing] B [Cyphellophora attinorum]|uniref:Amine oxidase n=1 Tax=Cyphellophora attinorum TaxID=1664694 RepID=A0A0N0NM77_9EURO|nr:Amine oxidase [flavin-containing] B [Phialophora attinorum]KPI39889.1 Amine oxidase [flavin-containing] B [Phialophora attinorum]
MPMGSLGKVYAIYDSPFWREDGLSGKAMGLQGATVQTTFDSSPEDGSFGAIIGFLEADEMRRLDTASEEEIQSLVLKDYVNFFGPRAREVKEWVIQRWDNEEYSRGGHFAVSPPNTMTRFGSALAQPVGRLFFAGTEASPYWAGFMDGAVRAGEMAADAVLDHETGTVVSRL